MTNYSSSNSPFYNQTGIKTIVIENGVTSIGDSAFYNCSGLKELIMPCSARIYNSWGTFYNCTNIEKVTLTKGAGTMQNYDSSNSAYETCYQYTPWYISRSNLKELVIEDGVKNIGSYAFCGCSGLTSVTIGNSVKSIGYYAFQNCSGLTSVTIPTSVTGIGDDAFQNCSGLTSVTIPNSVTSIGKYAFNGCSGLTSITIPDSVTSIGDSAFRSCSSLATIDVKGNNCSIYDSQYTLPENATIIINGSTNVYNYVLKYNRNFICNHIEESDEAKEPTCTDVGLTAGTHCKVCGTVLVEQEISAPSLGHTPAEAVKENEVAPTCTKDGSYDEVIYCTVCIVHKTEEKRNKNSRFYQKSHSFFCTKKICNQNRTA